MSSRDRRQGGGARQLHAFIGRAGDGGLRARPRGEAGIGKSTLWLAAIDEARARGLRVLSSRPAEAERELAHVGLGDLFDGVLDDVLPTVSAPRRRALEVACSGRTPPTSGRRPRTRGGGARRSPAARQARAGRDRGRRRPVARSDLVERACIRVAPARRERCALAARAADLEGGAASGSSRRSTPSASSDSQVGPLSVGGLHRFLRDRLGRSLPRQTLLRIHERSGGNPFFALELARGLDADLDPLRQLTVPETLEELVRARFSGFPRSTREALALVSALGATLGVAARARRSHGARARSCIRRTCDRAGGRTDPLHPPVAGLGPVPGPGRRTPADSRTDRRTGRRSTAQRPPSRPLGGRARRRGRRRARRAVALASRSRRGRRRGRTRRAGAAADISGTTGGTRSSWTCRGALTSVSRRVDSRADDRTGPAG